LLPRSARKGIPEKPEHIMLWKNALENLILGTILFSPGGRTNPKLHDESRFRAL
jgi:hypothetical protein